MTDVQAKCWLVLAKGCVPVWSRLSGNLVREVCTYLADCLYPCVNGVIMKVHNLATGVVTEKRLTQTFNNGTVFCLYTATKCACVGQQPNSSLCFSLCIYTAEVTPLPDMQHNRGWPGVIAWKNSVYVFGGNNDPPIAEAEKLELSHTSWQKLPSMSTPRVAFTPLLHRNQFYLISGSSNGPLPIETFDPLTDTYHHISVSIQGSGYGATSFLRGDEILVVLYGGKVVQWNPSETTYTESTISLPDGDCAITSTPVGRYQDNVYWVKYLNGALVKVELSTCTFVSISQ